MSITLLSLVALSAPAVAADSTPLPGDALATVAEVIPSVLDDTAPGAPVSVDGGSGTIAVGDAPEIDGQTAPGVSFTIDYASEVTSESDAVVELAGEDPNVAALVQPTNFGVRVMTVISDASAPKQYDYTFDVPKDTKLTEGGAAYYLESGNDLLGTLLNPWAVDANGSPVPTTYTWNDAKLTQHVDLDAPGIEFPVVVDPAWSYGYKFSVTKTAAANKALLKSCFNCYFPVNGAPRSFPNPGQLLPLKVGTLNFECKFKSEFTGSNYFGFQFDATKNHVDKLGSNIIFEFKTIGSQKYLTVSAYIVNDSIWVNNAFYRSGAIQAWKNFAANLNRA